MAETFAQVQRKIIFLGRARVRFAVFSGGLLNLCCIYSVIRRPALRATHSNNRSRGESTSEHGFRGPTDGVFPKIFSTYRISMDKRVASQVFSILVWLPSVGQINSKMSNMEACGSRRNSWTSKNLAEPQDALIFCPIGHRGSIVWK